MKRGNAPVASNARHPTAVGSIGGYLLLNLIFLALEGVTNPNQGGALRVALFLFVFLTVGLSSGLTYLTNRLKAG